MITQPFAHKLTLRLTIYLLALSLIAVMVMLAWGLSSPKRVIAYVTSADYVQKVHIMDVGLGIIRKVSDYPVFGCCPMWSPDGTQIAFTSSNFRSFNVNIFRGGDQLLNAPSRPSQVAAWSPDSTTLLLTGAPAGIAELYHVDANGDNLRIFTENIDDSLMQVWSPDGRYIVFVSGRGYGEWNIFRMDSDGSNVLPLTSSSGEGENNMFPAVSPDSQRIAFVSDRDSSQDVYLMNIDGSNLQRLTATTSSEMLASWSPDGQKLLVIAQPLGLTSGDIYVIDVANGNTRQLIQHGGFIFSSSPSWSPDGSEILFVYQNESGAADIYITNADGGNMRRLTDNPDLDSFPAWQP
jgi:Tol biopolymer transport system component